MTAKFSEEQGHEHLYEQGLEQFIEDAPEIDIQSGPPDDEVDFQLWWILKEKAIEKISALHAIIRNVNSSAAR